MPMIAIFTTAGGIDLYRFIQRGYKMKNKSLAIGLIFASAGATFASIPLTAEQEQKIFVDAGLPLPGSGIHIIPMNTLKNTDKKLLRNRLNSMSQKGYVAEENQNALMMLNMESPAQQDIVQNISNTDPQSTHMHKTIDSMKLAFPYTGVNPALVSKVIGYSVAGKWMDQGGWSAVVEFFKPKDIDPEQNTICSYTQYNMSLTEGAANLAQEIVSYKVNGKPTIMEISGSPNTAYGYLVEWYDDIFRHELSCANKNFSADYSEKVLNLAKKIEDTQ